MAFELPPLPYDYNALEPHIDAQTMQIHHDLHHGAYVTNLNNAIKDSAVASWSIDDLISRISEVPENIRAAVRNNGGGHFNHSMFWQIMGPNKGGAPTGELASAINQAFGSFEKFKETFKDAGVKRFGSGWAWLILDKGGKLQVVSTANQDNPLSEGHYPVMGNDVWEHAYYLKYQNKRPAYLDAWWGVVNWDAVASRYQKGRSR
ncbi:MAG TPA: superoxide dismutase [Ktedonobacteraceae bacterium]|jgi:Fe-Mn family superoxide dismutase